MSFVIRGLNDVPEAVEAGGAALKVSNHCV
jgi:hypothetical protein